MTTTDNNSLIVYDKGLSPDNLTELSQYGYALEEELGQHAADVSKQLAMKDTGDIGDLLSDMRTEISTIQLAPEKGILGAFKKLVNKSKMNIIALQSQYDTVSVTVDKIASELTEKAKSLQDDNLIAQQIADDAMTYFNKLEASIQDIVAARAKMTQELNETTDENRKAQLNRAIDIASRRQSDMVGSQALARNQYESMQLLIAGNITLSQDLHTAIHSNIPQWKVNLNVAAIINRQDIASRIKESVSEASNEMIRANAKNLKESSVRIAKEANRPLIDPATIIEAQQTMISSIAEIQTAYNEVRTTSDKNIAKLTEINNQTNFQSRLTTNDSDY